MEINESELEAAICDAFGKRAQLQQVERITETFNGRTAWDGVVHVFALDGHPEAKVAYAWTAPIEGSTKRRFYTVLGKPPINSAADAVRAAIVAEHRNG